MAKTPAASRPTCDERLAAALRANLKRRKAGAGGPETPPGRVKLPDSPSADDPEG